MKIEKQKGKYYNGVNWFDYYYRDSKTSVLIRHGLYYDNLLQGIGYFYHREQKGFWLKNKYNLNISFTV